MIASLVVYRNLDLIRLVNVEFVSFFDPAVVSGGFSAPLDGVLNFDIDECLGSSTESTSSCVINIGDCVYCQGKVATQRLALAGYAQAVVYNTSQSMSYADTLKHTVAIVSTVDVDVEILVALE